MKRTVVINVVGLCDSVLANGATRLQAFAQKGSRARIVPALPAVTCTAQSNYLTGLPPSGHGIVGNGWYNREMAETQFWKQSNHLVHGRKIWEELRDEIPGFTCAKLFWWYNMYSTADFSITPRPMYPADGRKVFDIYTWPFSIRKEIKAELGEFPFPAFWGPAAGVDSKQFKGDAVSRWIAASAKWIERKHRPSLSLVYLPHLDYNLQRFGPKSEAALRDHRIIDEIVGDLISFFEGQGVQVVILSEYGISEVNNAVHLNRLFRGEDWIEIKEELGLELLDCGASRVFAVADHQLAHIYLNDRSLEKKVRALLERTEGVDQVLDGPGKKAAGLDHERAGDLVAIAKDNAWFTYYYWMDDAVAPDFARCVDIHRKPGYDPVELFIDPAIKAPMLKIAGKLLRKKLGFRMLMDLIPLDANLVKGSHGRIPSDQADYPLLILPGAGGLPGPTIQSTDVFSILKRTIAA